MDCTSGASKLLLHALIPYSHPTLQRRYPPLSLSFSRYDTLGFYADIPLHARVFQTIKDVGASCDALVDLLESIGNFLGRLDIYTKFPPAAPTAAMRDIIVKIMVELLSTIALVTKQIKQKLPRESLLNYWSFDSAHCSKVDKEALGREGGRGCAAEARQVDHG